jgi:hypothetical protein
VGQGLLVFQVLLAAIRIFGSTFFSDSPPHLSHPTEDQRGLTPLILGGSKRPDPFDSLILTPLIQS